MWGDSGRAGAYRPGMTAPGTDIGRRRLLAGAVGGVGALALDALPAVAGGRGPRVVVVGAGLAGLACADLLHRRGVRAEVYEARADRVGGRCWTSYGWADGQVAEHGGEFIDTRHRHMRHLVRRFGLRLEDLYTTGAGGHGRLWLDGGLHLPGELESDQEVFRRRIRRLRDRIGPYIWPDAGPAAKAIDEMTARDVVDRYMPGGSNGLAGRRQQAYLASFLGLDLDRLGGLAVVDCIDLAPGADERYHVQGGNEQVVHGLLDALPRGSVTRDAPLRRLRRRGDGTYALRLGGVRGEVVADQVVLCLPFTALREVDLDAAGLSRHKLRSIRQLGMGTNAKVILQLAHRPQQYQNWTGYLRSDHPTFDTWESSAAQRGTSSVLTVYYGGRSGAAGRRLGAVHGPTPRRVVERVVDTLTRHGETHLSGLRGDVLHRSRADHWARDRWTHGSYAAFLPGQYTRYAGFVGRPEGGVHFAGEHTAPLVDQGYLEGAVLTGLRAAREVLRSVGVPAVTG